MNKIFTFTLVGALSLPFMANAVDVPSTADSSRFQQKLNDRGAKSQITNEVLIKDEQDSANPDAGNIGFTLSSFDIEGNTVFEKGELERFYANKIGKEVTLLEMYEVRDQITKYYRDKGYVLSRAVIPAQKLGKGKANFKIRIIEGYLNSVSVDGEFKGDKDILDNYIEKIKAGGPLNSANLERYLLLLNDLPGVTANAVLKPAAGKDKVGASDLVIQMTNEDVNGVLTLDNSGSKFIGRELITGEARINSQLGLSEEFRLRGIVSGDLDELRYGDISYKMPIGYEGTMVRVSAGKTSSKPGSTLKSLEIEGDTSVYEAEVTHPFLRSRKENLSGRVSFAAKNTDTDSGATDVYKDRTREVTIGGTYDLADSWDGVNLIDFSATQGLDILGETNALPSRVNGETNFTKFNFEANRLQTIDGTFGVLFAATGQYSLDPLLAAQEFGVGGSEIGRGYDFSEVTGDHGLSGKVELQYGVDFNDDIFNTAQLYAFYDIGTVWQEDPVAGEEERDSLSSTGLGTRFNLIHTTAGYVEVAKPLTKELGAENDRDWRFNFGFSYIF